MSNRRHMLRREQIEALLKLAEVAADEAEWEASRRILPWRSAISRTVAEGVRTQATMLRMVLEGNAAPPAEPAEPAKQD